MKKNITFTLTINNPTEQALEDILKAIDNVVDDLEYLCPIADIEIKYTKS